VVRTVELAEDLDKPLIFVVNAAPARANITVNVAVALSQHGTLAPSIIHQRSDFASSMIDGRTVMEISRKSPSAGEIAELWEYLEWRLERLRLRAKKMNIRPNPYQYNNAQTLAS
jgi:chromosome partitioning protein